MTRTEYIHRYLEPVCNREKIATLNADAMGLTNEEPWSLVTERDTARRDLEELRAAVLTYEKHIPLEMQSWESAVARSTMLRLARGGI